VSSNGAVTPLAHLGRSWSLLAGAALCGALVGAGGAALAPKRWKATHTLVVLEPRLAGGGASVDYNLTSVRSYAALLASPALAETCRATLAHPAGSLPTVKVRVPENTRTLECSAQAADPTSVAAFVNCVAGRAIEENRRLNRELAQAAVAEVAAARDALRKEIAEVQDRLVAVRSEEGLERKSAEMKAAGEDIAAWAATAREALRTREEAEARTRSLSAAAQARPARRRLSSFLAASPEERAALPEHDERSAVVREEADPVRDLAEKGRAESDADAAAAGAAARAASENRTRGTRRFGQLESEIVHGEARVNALVRRLDGLSASQTELERRFSLARVDALSRALDLATFSPAVPPLHPAGPSWLLAGGAGALLATGICGLFVLSRME
jgi:hypothetical protein